MNINTYTIQYHGISFLDDSISIIGSEITRYNIKIAIEEKVSTISTTDKVGIMIGKKTGTVY